MNQKPDLSVVIPFYNEEGNIIPLLKEVVAAVSSLDIMSEVLCINDASKDKSLEEMHTARDTLSTEKVLIHAISHEKNCGQSAAIWTGGHLAKADWIVTLDGDGQNDPADIPKLWQEQMATDIQFDIYCGHRKNRKDTEAKKIASRLANSIRSFILNDSTPDTGCGIKLMSRQIFIQLPYFDHMHRYLAALYIRQGGKSTSVIVNHRPRERGQSKYGIFDRLWVSIFDLIGVMWLRKRARIPKVKAL